MDPGEFATTVVKPIRNGALIASFDAGLPPGDRIGIEDEFALTVEARAGGAVIETATVLTSVLSVRGFLERIESGTPESEDADGNL